ncbi:hypothetical protein OG915_13865 [Streptomyces sp. NBC_00151]|uniref:Secreted protein n=1 Tax=Streptomyces sp. NBC_01393 TaxID=2903851 RepID=A0AAU3I3T4_9ACTN|nr:hypothetical protein [Streptomyces sp. NBC_00151]WRZ39033.1 hypothetical protein OG915_13865 [Streptomyces sp. NBC_00151]
MAGRTVRRGACLALGALWWFSVLRLAFAPDAGVLEGAVAAGGWGLSLLPVHCVPKSRAAGAVGSDRWRDRRRESRRGYGRGGGWVTRAWRRRRWGGGSGRW